MGANRELKKCMNICHKKKLMAPSQMSVPGLVSSGVSFPSTVHTLVVFGGEKNEDTPPPDRRRREANFLLALQ